MPRTVLLLVLSIALCSIAGCALKPPKPKSTVKTPEARKVLAERWAYWLQHPNLAALVDYPADVVVIDYSYDGTDAKAFDHQTIRMLQRSGKKVLCYFSIGEAESYRFYWNPAWEKTPPTFLGPENPDWPANYKVRYWDPAWMEQALTPYMDRILDAGFDGVYLDIVDAYWYWHETDGIDVRKTANNMIALVADIARYMRGRAGADFIICPQNAEGIIGDASEKYRTLYLNTINMIGVESLFYNIFSPEDQKYRMKMLREYTAHGIRVFNVEYIPPEKYASYLDKVESVGFPITPYPSSPDATLNRLTPADWALAAD